MNLTKENILEYINRTLQKFFDLRAKAENDLIRRSINFEIGEVPNYINDYYGAYENFEIFLKEMNKFVYLVEEEGLKTPQIEKQLTEYIKFLNKAEEMLEERLKAIGQPMNVTIIDVDNGILRKARTKDVYNMLFSKSK